MTPDTYDVRRKAKLLSDHTLAVAIRDHLDANDVPSTDDVDNAPIIDEIRVELLGDDYGSDVAAELNDTISELTRPHGLVYHSLRDGKELCTTRLRRKIQAEDGGSIIINATARFLSDDPEVVHIYRASGQFASMERTMERVANSAAVSVSRVPGLAAYMPGMIASAHQTMQAKLPMPEEDEN